MAPRKPADGGKDMLTTDKLMQTFRMPRELVARLREEAEGMGLDLTAFIIKVLHGLLTDFGLPEAATAMLDEDRAALRMNRYLYVLHLLFQRSLAVRDQGPGFDAPGKGRKGH